MSGECREEGENSDIGGMPDECLTEVDGKETIIDEFDDCFVKTNSSKWLKLSNQGYDDHLYYSYVHKDKSDATGTWYLNVTKSGTYQISVYIAGIIGDVVKEIEYTVKAGKRVYHPTIITSDKSDGWVVLGKYELEAGELQYVELSDGGYRADDELNEMRVIFDAVKLEPKGSAGGNPEKDDDIKVQSSGSDCSVGGNWRNSSGLWLMMACFGGLVLLRRRKFSR